MESDKGKTKNELIAKLDALRKQVHPLDDDKLRQIMDGLPLFIYEIDLTGRLIYVNTPALTAFGYTAQDKIGRASCRERV